MYQKFFNFIIPPFSLVPDPHFMYMSEQHKEGLAHLLYGIKYGGGFSALTGEIGTGKTTLCHCLLDQLPDNIEIALVFNPKLTTLELLASIADELQITYNKNHLSLKNLIDSLNTHLLTSHANGKKTVLIIDEAQNLSLDVLEQIRLLTNLETTQTKLLQIILVGQPELKQLLEKTELRQLNQRITARYHLTPLSYLESKEYIHHRLVAAGGATNIFSPTAIKRIYKLSKGTPRLINILCDKALLGAYSTEEYTITEKIINQAAREIYLPSDYTVNEFLSKIGYGLLVLTLLTIIPYYVFVYQPQNKPANSIPSISLNTLKIEKKQKDGIPPEKITAGNTPVNLKKQTENIILSDFPSFLNEQTQLLNTKIAQLAKIWGKNISIDSGCKGVEESELKCLFENTNKWKHVIALNRPVILEFSLSKSDKRYALLSGLKEGQPVFQFTKEKHFPLDQVLSYWSGDYLLLWSPSVNNGKTIYPKESSREVFWIRKQLSLIPNHTLTSIYSALFDEELKTEIMKFQKKQNLTDDGIVGAKTFIHLQNINLTNTSPRLKLIQ